MRKYAYALAVASALAVSPVGAATIDLDDVGISWNGVSAVGSGSAVTGVGTSKIEWGVPFKKGGKKSGYGFVGLESTGHDVDEEFQLGTFTHFNNPINAGTSITKATLSLSFDLMVDGVAKSVDTAFDFLHWETSNAATNGKCANGSGMTGVNVNGCADRVTISSVLNMMDEFQIGNAFYTMQITGFLLNGVIVSEFWTKEDASNPAVLMAKFTKVRDIDTPPPAPVPLPATGLLVLAGLAGLAAAKRRRS
ncbi:THxN family PEP-CTERM protein [Rhodobacter sp. Har01]|uniref:THxN family PEP-CTERM protein n=1 Tax=Rhodobacter sp. Har01 TaxID=2883999 RepID=UPI001D07018F|nr:THxN family PEP-CTERM protein [Rhodobacter sp. Har01]MCB6179353.1 THxN family PEP-CTERM protein [Rhodobacter sp. Har01]